MKTYIDYHLQSIHHRPLKAIKFWQAYNGTLCIDENNSIAILRARYKQMPQIYFKAIR